MKAEYDLSKMKASRSPYASKLKKSVTVRLSEDVVQYFKGMATQEGVPYQSLINLYLRDCLAHNRRVEIKWPSAVQPLISEARPRRRLTSNVIQRTAHCASTQPQNSWRTGSGVLLRSTRRRWLQCVINDFEHDPWL